MFLFCFQSLGVSDAFFFSFLNNRFDKDILFFSSFNANHLARLTREYSRDLSYALDLLLISFFIIKYMCMSLCVFSKMLTNNDYNYASFLCTVSFSLMYFIYSDSGGILVLPHTVLATFSLGIFFIQINIHIYYYCLLLTIGYDFI